MKKGGFYDKRFSVEKYVSIKGSYDTNSKIGEGLPK